VCRIPDSHRRSLYNVATKPRELTQSPNRLLARLPPDDYRGLLPDLETIRLRPQRVLLKPHEQARKIYFPAGGVCSIIQVMADGQSAGVAIVGNEGLVGMEAFGGDPESGQTAVVEIGDADAQVMDARIFHREMDRGTAFKEVIHRYGQAFAESLMQSVVCNALHPIEKRCAKCLLDIRDRVGRNELPLTQNVLATMLGVRRASVTLAVGALHRAGIVDHVHKGIIICDPAGLEATTCECYALVKGHFSRLLP
jgi:CRP-like cAMP-binding protein